MNIDYIAILKRLIDVGIFFGIGLLLMKIVLTVERRTLKRSRLDEAIYLFVERATKVGLWIILIIMTLQMAGISTSSLVTVLGAGGAAIALALKDSLGNVAGGIIILVTKPFKKGDAIEITGMPGVIGIVDSIDLLTTSLHTVDNKKLTVPNGNITTSTVINYTDEEIRRLDMQFSIGYDSDFDRAVEILRKIAENDSRILKEMEPVIGMAEQGDSSIIIDFKVWCMTDDYYPLRYTIQEETKKAFDKEGIDIPFPQMDIHMK